LRDELLRVSRPHPLMTQVPTTHQWNSRAILTPTRTKRPATSPAFTDGDSTTPQAVLHRSDHPLLCNTPGPATSLAPVRRTLPALRTRKCHPWLAQEPQNWPAPPKQPTLYIRTRRQTLDAPDPSFLNKPTTNHCTSSSALVLLAILHADTPILILPQR
jgi:hypothetical protein